MNDKSFFIKARNSWRKKVADQSFRDFLTIVIDIFIYGAFLNFALFAVFNLPFTYYSWIGYGLLVHFAQDVIPRIVNQYRIK